MIVNRMIAIAASAALMFSIAVSQVSAQSLTFELIAASPATLAKPHDIKLSPDGKTLFVADNGNDRIVVLDAVDLSVSQVLAEGVVSEPHDVDFDKHGRMLVADTGNNRIAIFDLTPTGATLVTELTENIRRPEGVAVHADGRVFACGTSSGNLAVYEDGALVAQLDGLSSPHDVEFDLAGDAWVADTGADRMIRVNDELAIVSQISGAPFAFNGPRYMDFDAEGRMFVADKYSHQIKVISAAGQLAHTLGEARSGKGDGKFDRPEGVEIRGRDYWFSDTYNDRIVRYRLR